VDRLFKFPQMDFEMAIWEMTSLLIAPKKVFKSMYYHVSISIRRRRPMTAFGHRSKRAELPTLGREMPLDHGAVSVGSGVPIAQS